VAFFIFSRYVQHESSILISIIGADMLFFIACFGVKPAVEPPAPKPPMEEVVQDAPLKPLVILDGVTLEASWDDGDTFSAKHPETGEKIKARLNGYNTLESYGAVHIWGDWTAEELYTIAKESGELAKSKTWTCTDTKKGGGYGRILVDCPALRTEMLKAGMAHVFAIEAAAPQEDLDAMRFGMEAKNGMWEKGVPNHLVTSLHSQSEKPDKEVYNRVCDLVKGQCAPQPHQDTYEICEKVCIQDSCMIYVPYFKRYRNKAECLVK